MGGKEIVLKSRSEIPGEDRRMIDHLRSMYVEAGAEFIQPSVGRIYEVDSRFRPRTSGVEMIFDYDNPVILLTPFGVYPCLFNGAIIDRKIKNKFRQLLNRSFDVTTIAPQRDDSKISRFDYEVKFSGPRVNLKLKKQNS